MIFIAFFNILLQVSKSEDCSEFGPHCLACENGVCTKCDDNYGIDNDLASENHGKCVECAYNPSPKGSCKNCNDDYKTCIECNLLYGFDTDPDSQYYNKCRRCNDVSCDECYTDYTQCSKCEEGYGMNNDPNTLGYNTCDTCYGYCKICSHYDYKNCTECKNGYGLDDQNEAKCLNCDDSDCQLCKENYKVCIRCRPGYGFDSSGKCQKCQSSCEYCYEDSSMCEKCKSSYGKDNDPNSETYGQCINCKVDLCHNCLSDANKCDECGYNFFYDDDETSLTYGKCTVCSAGCIKCIDEKTCLKCNYGFGLNNGKCSRCKDHDCSYCYEDYSVCTYCNNLAVDVDKNSKTYGQCINCTSNCRICQRFDSSNCTHCFDDLGSDNGVCVETHMEHCLKFSSIDYCVRCEKGYASQQNYGVCLSTDDEYCDELHESGGFCVICKNNYTAVNGVCRKNINNCYLYGYSSYEPFYYCRQCEEGYGNDRNGQDLPCQCKKCTDPHCSKCNENNAICEECQLPFYLDKSTYTCVQECKAGNCSQCSPSDNTKCSICLDGYAFYQGCVKIITDHCRYSTYPTYCTECIEGYTVSDGTCYKCNVSNCLKCSSDNYCDECLPGFYLIDGKCNECNHKGCKCSSADPVGCYEYDCINGYGFDLTKGSQNYGKCSPCLVKNCKKCDENPDWCTKCMNDEMPNYDNECPAEPIITEEPVITEEPIITEGPIETTQEKSKKKLSTGAIAGIVVGAVVVVGLVSFLVYYFACRKKSAVSASSNSP